MADEVLVGLLHRNSADLPGLFKAGWHPVQERKNEWMAASLALRVRAEPSVQPRVLEESEDKRVVQLLDRKLGWSDAEAIGGKANQELEGISIGVAGVRAGFALTRQVLTEEATEMDGEHRHAVLPSADPAGLGHLTQQHWCRLEIPVGIGNPGVAEIGRERKEVPVIACRSRGQPSSERTANVCR